MVILLVIIVFAVIMIAWAENKDPGGPVPKPPKAPATRQEWAKYEHRLIMKEQAVGKAKFRKEIRDRIRREQAGENLGEHSSNALLEEYTRKYEK